jgi:hypothetical protein
MTEAKLEGRPKSSKGKHLKEYSLWKDMLLRSTTGHQEKFPCYTGCTISENFKNYSYFYDWCQEQTGSKTIDENGRYWQLDKDLLYKGNKLYSEDTCIFLPQRINGLLIKQQGARGEYPVGVYLSTNIGKFIARCHTGKGARKNLGRFDTPYEAFSAYKRFKEALIKEIAGEYKEQLDSRTYHTLINYKVEIDD